MKKKWTQKSVFTMILVLAVAAFGMLNVCARLAGDRFALSLDLTENQLYLLSDTTVEAVGGLSEPTTVYVLADETEYPGVYRELLARFEKLSGYLTVRYMPAQDNPLFISHYEKLGMNPEANGLLIEGGSRTKTIAYEETLVYNGADVSGIDLEQQLTSAILYVNSTDQPTALFTTGHSERPTEALKKLFESNHFVTGNIALAVEEAQTPEILVIAAPAYDFTEAETKAVSEYLERGGRVMAFVEPSAMPMPNLFALLAQWGIGVESNIVFEPTAYAAGTPNSVIPMYASHPANAYFADHPVYCVLPATRSLTLGAADNHAEASALLLSTGDAYAKMDTQYISSAKEAGDQAGPFVLAALSQRRVAQDTDAMLFVMGSRLMYADDLMGMSSYANRLFLTQVTNHLWQQTQMISIPPKQTAAAPLAITTAQSLTVGAILGIALPLAVLAAGMAVWLKRRRL